MLTNVNAAECFDDAENWLHGPTLDVTLKYTAPGIAALLLDAILRDEIVTAEIGDQTSEPASGTARKTSTRCVIYDAARFPHPLAARCFLDESRDEVCLAICPRLMRRACREYDDRSTTEWPSRGFVDLHVALVALVRRLNQRVPIRLAEINDEAYSLGAWSAGGAGIAIDRKFADAGAFSIVRSTEAYAILSLGADRPLD